MSALEAASAAVTVTETVHQGIPCLRVETPAATYLYDKAGAGFVSIVDRDGHEWVGFRPEGSDVPDGRYGWFRGLPNMAVDRFGHPGYRGATSIAPDPGGMARDWARVHSRKGAWEVTWDFFPTFARMTVHRTDGRFWLLYEGTPGGALDAHDTCWRSDGIGLPCGEAWEGDVLNTAGAAPGSEWVAFADAAAGRSLVLIHPDDTIADTYFPLPGMAVFGFGRTTDLPLWMRALRRLGLMPEHIGLLEQPPDMLVVSFAEATDFAGIAAHVDRTAAMARLLPEPRE